MTSLISAIVVILSAFWSTVVENTIASDCHDAGRNKQMQMFESSDRNVNCLGTTN